MNKIDSLTHKTQLPLIQTKIINKAIPTEYLPAFY